jgi:methionyl aminopeptidase
LIRLKTPAEIETIARAGEIVAGVLELVAEAAQPDVTTGELDRLAEEYIRSHEGAKAAFKGLYGFPGTLCTSVNSEVVHGIPSADRSVEEGAILSMDVGVMFEEMFADAAITVSVGEPTEESRNLIRVTRQALDAGIAEARSEARLGDIGAAIQEVVESAGYSVIRELVGHGVGHAAHEEPQVPNYGRRGQGLVLDEGLVIAVEPMVNVGRRHIRTLEDGWTVVTADDSLSAHYEHTVAVTADGPRILTHRPEENARRDG